MNCIHSVRISDLFLLGMLKGFLFKTDEKSSKISLGKIFCLYLLTKKFLTVAKNNFVFQDVTHYKCSKNIR